MVVVWLGNIPLRLAFRARVMVVWLGNIPLHLAFRAREGVVWLRKHPPPSRVSSEGGDGEVVQGRGWCG